MERQTYQQIADQTFGRTYGGKNAATAIQKYDGKTPYTESTGGYGKLVGVQFDGKGKVYNYVDLKGTTRTGDHPAVEVTNKFTNANTVVPGRHTKVVSTAKAGIDKNNARLDTITNKGINLKVIDRSAIEPQLQAQKATKKLSEMSVDDRNKLIKSTNK